MLSIFTDHCVHGDVVAALQTLPKAKVIRALDVSLAQSPDEEIFQYTKEHGYILLTFDKDFGNLTQFDPEKTAGIVLVYIERMSREQIITSTKEFFEKSTLESLRDKLSLVEPMRIRILPH